MRATVADTTPISEAFEQGQLAQDVQLSPDGRSVILHTCIQTLGITTTSLPDGEVDVPYAGAQLTAAGGEQPYTFVAESDMPTGLTLNPSTGQISGTPDTGGSLRTTPAWCGPSWRRKRPRRSASRSDISLVYSV